MDTVRKFERKFLFPLTRGFALVLISVLLLGIATMALQLVGGGIPSSHVAATDVIHALRPQTDTISSGNGETVIGNSSDADTDSLRGKKIPFQVQKYIDTPQNLSVLQGWLNNVPVVERQAFLDELAETISVAEKSGMDVDAAIDKYREIKFIRLQTAGAAEEELRQTRIYYIGGISGGIALIALFSLILVLLSIERNTRHRSNE